MKISDLTVEVRDSTLARVGQILPADLIGLELALRFNKVGSWKLKLRSDHPMVDALRTAGGGIIVTGENGVVLSGPTVSAKNTKTAADPTGYWEIIGTDDTVLLGERLAYPVPSTADLTLQTSAYDTRTGAAETVVKAYVNANIGPSAPAARKITSLTIDTDLGRGNTVTGTARFETLGALCEQLLITSQLGFDISQSGAGLKFFVYQPTDRSQSIRMDVDNLRLTKSEYSYAAPQATRVIVAGQGQGADRTFIERTSTESTTAETTWGRRIEVFKDQRNTDVTAELEQAGDEILVEKGKTIEGISVTPSDDETMRFGFDWGLGDKVSVVVNDTEVAQIVTEVAIVVTDSGIKVGATVGDPATASADTETSLIGASTEQEARISALERNEPASSGGGTGGPVDWDDVTGKPSTFAPSAHASTHASGGSDPITVAQSQVTGLSTALAGKVDTSDSRLTDARTPTAHVHSAADVTSGTLPVVRGGTGAGTADTARANLSAVGVFSQATEPTGGNVGDVWIDTSSEVNSWSSFMPYSMAAGSATLSVSANTFAIITVTFPVDRFSQSPIVSVTKAANTSNAAGYVTAVSNVTTTGMSVQSYDNANNATNRTLSFPVHWYAIQMTPTAANG